MSYTTIDSLPTATNSRRQTLTRNSSSMAHRPKTPSLVLTTITKTISNNFFKPQKLPQALEERQEHKTVGKPFYTKNRKMLQVKNRKQALLPNGFKNMLRAKSTVIKQKKLQQFYINRQGRESEVQNAKYYQHENEDSKSNLFRSNFPMKRSKQRGVNSVSLEKKVTVSRLNNIEKDVIKVPTKAITIHALTQDLTDIVLKQKQIGQNNPKTTKQATRGNKIQWNNFRKKKKQVIDNKENMEFDLQPWAANDNEDCLF